MAIVYLASLFVSQLPAVYFREKKSSLHCTSEKKKQCTLYFREKKSSLLQRKKHWRADTKGLLIYVLLMGIGKKWRLVQDHKKKYMYEA